MKTYFLCVAFLLCGAAGAFSQRSSSDSSTPAFSTDPQLLMGKWDVFSRSGRPDRVDKPVRSFEFFPDGVVFDTSFYTSSSGDSSERRRRNWKQMADRILISGNRDSEVIEIRLPFDTRNLELTEIISFDDTTRTTTLKAERADSSPEGNFSSDSSASEAFLDDEPLSERITTTTAIARKSQKQNYYQTETVTLNITLKNGDMKFPTGPLKVDYWVLARNLKDQKQFAVLQKGTVDAAMGTGINDREFKTTTDPVINRYYNYPGYRSGYETNGWILRVTNRRGKILALEASRPEWKRNPEQLDKLEKRRVYTGDLKLLEGVAYYDYSY